MKYFLVFLYITLISNLSFADELMKCYLKDKGTSETHILIFKLEENYFKDDKIYSKSNSKWISYCSHKKVKNKSITCHQGNQSEYNPFNVLDNQAKNIFVTVDFQVNTLEYTGYGVSECKRID